MGSGVWTSDVYEELERMRKARGESAFAYSATVRSRAREEWRVHPSLDPQWRNRRGERIRESRDSAEHPESTPIAVMFDVTGSMLGIPVILQKKLPELLGLLLRKAYVPDPQILFGAIGDATCDRVPLQVGQFESDNRMDTHLGNLVLEGGGGGQLTESYELAMYFLARHTPIDIWEKRRKKGYVFLMGDECAYRAVKRTEVAQIIGDEVPEDIPVRQILAELRERYTVFHIFPKSASHGGEKKILDFWRGLLGQNVLELDEPEAVCETIALAVGLNEGVIDLDEGVAHLTEMSAPGNAVSAARTAVAKLPMTAALVKSVVALPGPVLGKGSTGREYQAIRL
jgi:hypothetical protein